PATSLLMALGMDGEEILSTFYETTTVARDGGDGWKLPLDADKLRGTKPNEDLIDAKTGEVVAEAGKKITARLAKQIKEKKVKALRVTDDALIGRYIAGDIVNLETGEIHAEAGDEVTAKMLAML